MTDKPKLTLIIKSIYGSLYAYPADDFTRLLLHLKDKKVRDNVIKPAQCFAAHDIHRLQEIAAELGAELIEEYRLKNKNDETRWQDEKGLFSHDTERTKIRSKP